jgi:dipeptidyl aminopeptidase/acylaminoacyl peptidase
MTGDRRIERALPVILADLGAGPMPDYTDLLLARTARSRQRPAWVFPERWLPVDVVSRPIHAPALPWRLIGALVLALLIAAAALAIYIGSRPRVPEPFGVAGNGAFAYSVTGDIWTQDGPTGTPRVIVKAPENDNWPLFSPDGTHVAFVRGVTGDLAFVVSRSDGTDVRQVSTVPLGDGPWWWGWTPDSRSIAAVLNSDEDSRILIFDAIGSAPVREIETGLNVDAPAFRPPHGDEILFRGDDGTSVGLYVMKADGSGLRPIVPPRTLANDDGSTGDYRNPAWSPDGSQIVYQEHSQEDGWLRLYVANADGSGAHAVGYTAGDRIDDLATWSPDGSRIAFERLPESGGWDYAVVRLSDGVVTTLQATMSDGGSPLLWAPDGSKLLAVPWLGDHATLLDPAGGPEITLPWGSGGEPSTGIGAGAGAHWQRLAP